MALDDQLDPSTDPTAKTSSGAGTGSEAATSLGSGNPAPSDGPRWAPEPDRTVIIDVGRVADVPLSQVGTTTTMGDGPSTSVSSSNGNAALVRQSSAEQPGSTQGHRDDSAVDKEALQTSLLGSALIALSVGAIVMVVIYRVTSTIENPRIDQGWVNEIAIAAGLLASGLTVFLYSRLSRGTAGPDRVNPWQYGELCSRRDYLEASFSALCPENKVTAESTAVCQEAGVHIQRMGEELGVISRRQSNPTGQANQRPSREHDSGPPDKWILGTGFVELWQRLHAAEAALLGLRPIEQRLSYANHDSMRLSGCGMDNGGALKTRLDLAIATLEKIYRKGIAASDASEVALATQTLISIRKTVDDYRDQSRAGLARTRVHLIWAGVMTAVVAYTLLALAILDDVPVAQIVAGAAFFLVGAVAGLIWQLRNSGSEIRSGEDDFGLDTARLVYVPVLSGLAGVGGVLVMAMLYPTLNVVPNTSEPANAGKVIPEIEAIFDLNRNRFGLLVAAVFGLTPDLLINRLKGEADRYRTSLESTSIQTGTNDPFVLNEAALAQIRTALALKSDGETDATVTTDTTEGIDTSGGSISSTSEESSSSKPGG